jgi:predicted ArsR family transcriptional regulator
VTPVEISNQDDAKGIKIRKIDRQILEKVFECPFRNTEKISEFMGNLNLAVAKRSLKKLETQGYVKSFNANLGFGRPKKLYIGTEKGATLLGEDYKKVKPKGKGSLLHQAAQHLLSGALGDSGQEGFGGA